MSPARRASHRFHLYTMRQAIEEKFILDVLKNYTTYETYYRIVQATQDDIHVEPGKLLGRSRRGWGLAVRRGTVRRPGRKRSGVVDALLDTNEPHLSHPFTEEGPTITVSSIKP